MKKKISECARDINKPDKTIELEMVGNKQIVKNQTSVNFFIWNT